MTSTQANANRILIWMCGLIGPIALGAAADLFGADATLGVTALLLVVVSLVFWRLAPESFRPSGI
jgi:hypothetical protein